MFSLSKVITVTLLYTLAGVSGLVLEQRASKCDISDAKINGLPSGLAVPTAKPSFLILGVGTQNYTCSSAGTYTAAGAVASLFDVSCLHKNKAIFPKVPDLAMAAWKLAPRSVTAESMMKTLSTLSAPAVLGQHYFITNPITGQGTSPLWDFRTQKAYRDKPDAFVVVSRVAGAPAPKPERDIDWLQLKNIQGGLADEVYRTDTREGKAPATCQLGSPPIQVKYVSLYWMYGGSINV